MAIYHLSAGFISRSTGRSCVQAAAYMAREQLYETRRALTADYRREDSDLVYTATLAPEGAPSWMSSLKAWDALETFEDRYAYARFKSEDALEKHLTTAQVGQTIVLALPRELPREVCQELVEQFAQTRFVARRLIVTAAIHDDGKGNPHAHLLISRRAYESETGSFALKKDRGIVTKYELNNTRRIWAELTNSYLEREALDARIDHRSYADQGLDLLPTYHRGWYASYLAATGKDSRIIVANQEIEEANREKILSQPQLILQELTLRQATFSKADLGRLLQKRLGNDEMLARSVYEVCAQAILPVGQSLSGELRYTTKSYQEHEVTALKLVDELLDKTSALEVGIPDNLSQLNQEQTQAVELLCGNHQLAVLVGLAGAGKTTLLRQVVEAHQTAGYQVVGMALAANAAENLGTETDCDTNTIAFYVGKWQRLQEARQRYWSLHTSTEHKFLENAMVTLSQHALTARHLVIVDEAGMVGTKDWAAILKAVEASGAKLIAVGDDQQFKAIEAGDLFRKLKEKAEQQGKLVSLNNILRQQEPWMREASHKLASLQTYEALADYERHGLLHSAPRAQINSLLVKDYVEAKEQQPRDSQLILAYTRAQCRQLNEEVRTELQAAGWIDSKDYTVGDKKLAVGEQIVFLQNHKKLGVKNGTLGRITAIEARSAELTIIAAIDEKTTIKFNPEEHKDFAHGYALTLHKAQGQTIDRTFVLASQHMDAHSVYVALTRHRCKAKLYYASEDFADFKVLQKSLGRTYNKDLMIDYAQDNRNPEQIRVHDYVILGQDLSTLAREKEWQTFTEFKQERSTLGKAILEDWEEHKEFARQAGISKESIEIACQLKQRPLSRAEGEAYQLATAYQAKAIAARQLWQIFKNSHVLSHEKYPEYSVLRAERDQLASELYSRPGLLSLAYRVTELRVARKTIEAQATSDGLAKQAPYQQKPSVVAEEVKQCLQLEIRTLTRELLGEPQRKSAREWRYGSKGSIAVFVAGSKQGLYANFETGIHGSGLQMIQEHLNLAPMQAYQWALNWLGAKHEIARPQPQLPSKQANWSPVLPVPATAPAPQLKALKSGFKEVAKYTYHDQAGQLLGYVVRLENERKEKVTLPLTYCHNGKDKYEWLWQGFGEQRPLYGVAQLAQHHDKPVLIVEGEKTAVAAQKLLPEYVVATWQGGAHAVNKVDWSCLQDRSVTIWPDHDEAGLKAAQKLSQALPNANIVNLPSELPLKWDLADPLPIGWDVAKVRASINSALPTIFYHPEKVKKVLESHGICYPSPLPTPEHIGFIHQDLKQWATIGGTPEAPLHDKAILAAYLHTKAQSKWYYGSSDPLTCSLKAQQVSYIAADALMKQVAAKPNYYANVPNLIDQAVSTYHTQQKTLSALAETYQQQYPQASAANLTLLAEQHLLYTQAQGAEPSLTIQQTMLLAIEETHTTRTKAFENIQGQEATVTKYFVPRTLTQQILSARLIHKEANINSLLSQSKEYLRVHLNLLQQQEQVLERSLSIGRDIGRSI